MENLLPWVCHQVKSLIKDDYRVLLALLATFAGVLWQLQRGRQKSLPTPTWPFSLYLTLSWAVRDGAFTWVEFANTFAGIKIWTPSSGSFIYLFLFQRNIYICLYVYIRSVLTCMKGKMSRGSGENENYPIWYFYPIFYNKCHSFILFLLQLGVHYSVNSNYTVVLLANVKLKD